MLFHFLSKSNYLKFCLKLVHYFFRVTTFFCKLFNNSFFKILFFNQSFIHPYILTCLSPNKTKTKVSAKNGLLSKWPQEGAHPNTTHNVQPKANESPNNTVKIQNKGHFCWIHEVVSVALKLWTEWLHKASILTPCTKTWGKMWFFLSGYFMVAFLIG